MRLKPSQVTACLVTRGDVDMTAIIASLPYDDVIVWDNSRRENLRTYGRYAAIAEAANDVIYVQDDDHILHDHQGLLAAYTPGTVVANMSAGWVAAHGYHNDGMVGKGGLMDRDLPQRAFDRYLAEWPDDELFRLWPDMLVTTLNPVIHVDLETEELPWGYAPNRMNQRPRFNEEKHLMLDRARALAEVARC